MITGIYIENFKGIGEPGVKLDLEPVTLLFGSNSAGKSTIFHAILLAYEVLVRGNRNPDKTELGGSVVDLGGFPCFVHQHEQQRNIRLRFELDLSSVSLDQEWRIDERVVDVDWVSVDADNIGSDVWSASVQIDLSWDESRRRPFVSKYIVELDEQQFAEIEDFRLVGGSVLLHVDPSHPVLRWSHKGPNDSIGVLDYFHHSFRTPAEELYLDAIPIVIPGLQSLLDDSSRPEVDEIEGTERPNTNDPVNMVTELESLAHLRQLGDLEVRRILHEDASGRI